MPDPFGNAFSRHYFDFDSGKFVGDYEEVLVGDLPTFFHVENSWENYERLKARIDARYAEWRRGSAPRRQRWR